MSSTAKAWEAAPLAPQPARAAAAVCDPANDNRSAGDFATYADDLRHYAGALYVPARAKDWSLP